MQANSCRWSVVMLALVAAPSLAEDQVKGTCVDVLVAGNSEFAVKLYGRLTESDENLFFSPHSISSALAMTYAGARESTADQMKGALSLALEPPALHDAFKKLNQELLASEPGADQKLAIVNGLCLVGGGVSADFMALLKAYYDAELFSGAEGEINAWIKQKTEGKIEKILESGLGRDTKCVILNAIYFKGKWESKFEHGRTANAPFSVRGDRHVTVPLMHQSGEFKVRFFSRICG